MTFALVGAFSLIVNHRKLSFNLRLKLYWRMELEAGPGWVSIMSAGEVLSNTNTLNLYFTRRQHTTARTQEPEVKCFKYFQTTFRYEYLFHEHNKANV